jgi:acetoin utilization deacetylase AcuC-like enzyme
VEEFMGAWNSRVLPALNRFSPELLLVSAGFDADRRDPLAQLQMDAKGYYKLTSEIVAFANQRCGGRIVSLLEGGYDPDALAQDVGAHLEALLERPYYH